MSERDERSGSDEQQVRDFDAAGDVGQASHSAFADERDGEPTGNDERLGMRGRNTGPGESGMLDALDADRARDARAEHEPGG